MYPSSTPTSLIDLLQQPGLDFLMEAHNGLSARIVEETGFSGIWASGLSIAASLGVRDCNEASWTQILDVAEFMRDAAPSTPILLDGDSGFGNFNNVRRLVSKLEQRGIDGVCLEDKAFPKRNSFIEGEQLLESPEEFAGKIRAAKDSQDGSSFCVIARLEGFIAGLPKDEVLDRADIYTDAGADAILVHSKRTDASEIFSFLNDWDRDCPIVVVPTTYSDTPAESLEAAGISLAIWANHLMRSSLHAMQETCRLIYRNRSPVESESTIAPLSEVFRLQRMDELKEAESRYGASSQATGQGSEASSRHSAPDPADVILPD